jgi:hypothetical protein
VVPYGPHAWLVLLAPAIFVIFFASTLLHELAHLIGALAMKLELYSFAVWPLQWVRAGRNFQIRRFNWQQMLGQVAAYPKNVERLLWKRAVLLGSGPLGSLLVAMGSMALAYALNESPHSIGFSKRLLVPRSGATLLLFAASLVNFYDFFLTMRPIPFKKCSTDGAALIAIIWSAPLMIQSWLIETLSLASRNGVRPRELNGEIIEYLIGVRNGSILDVDSSFFAFYYRLDAAQVEPAGELIDQIATNWEKYDSYHQLYAVLEKAYFEARYRHNVLDARRWLDQTPQGTIEQQTHLRAEAAVLLAEGRYKEAAEKAATALDVLPKSADPGGAIAEKEWLESILAESQRQIG